jgi:hypothetical protein
MNKSFKKALLATLFLTLGIGFVPVGPAAYAADDDSEVSVNVEFENPITSNTLDQVVSNLTDFVFTIALIVCPLVIIIGGFLFVTAGGDPKKVETGKKMIFWALVGLTIAMLAKGAVVLLRALLGVKKSTMGGDWFG